MWSVSAERVAGLDHGDADGRVRDGVEGEAGLLVGEGDGGQGRAVDRAVGGDDARAEAIDERLVGRAAGRDDVAGDLVGVDEDGAPFDEQVGDGGLARADATREADGQHLGGAVPAGRLRALAAGRGPRRRARASCRRARR